MSNLTGVTLRQVAADFRQCWRPLAVMHLVYGALAAVLLVPASTYLVRSITSRSQQPVLSDLEVARFYLSPQGAAQLFGVGCALVTISALHLAVLMVIGLVEMQGQRIGYRDVLRFVFARAPRMLVLGGALVLQLVAIAAPFVAIGGAAYWALLTDFDINYYLARRPREFWMAGGVLVLLLAALCAAQLYAAARWCLAPAYVLFAGASPREALRTSAATTAGRRRSLLGRLAVWFLVTTLLSYAVVYAVHLAGRLTIPLVEHDLRQLVLVIGLLLLASGIANYVVGFVGFATFGLLLVRVWLALDPRAGDAKTGLTGEDDAAPREAISGRRLAWGSCGLIVVAAVLGGLALRGASVREHVEVIAHRGASAAAPENTLAAFEQAIADGADYIELDVQEISDGTVVVFHDSDFKRQGGRHLKIRDATRDQLAEIDIGSWFDPKFADQRVPTLEQVLDLCRGRIRLIIELKYYGHDQQLEQRVIDLVEAKQMVPEVMVMSLERAGVEKVRKLRPDWRVGLLTSVTKGDVAKLDVDFLAVNAATLSPNLIERAAANNMSVLVWTVNDPLQMSRMASRRVRGIITDKPAAARRVLAERAELTPHELLLLEASELLGYRPQQQSGNPLP